LRVRFLPVLPAPSRAQLPCFSQPAVQRRGIAGASLRGRALLSLLYPKGRFADGAIDLPVLRALRESDLMLRIRTKMPCGLIVVLVRDIFPPRILENQKVFLFSSSNAIVSNSGEVLARPACRLLVRSLSPSLSLSTGPEQKGGRPSRNQLGWECTLSLSFLFPDRLKGRNSPQ